MSEIGNYPLGGTTFVVAQEPITHFYVPGHSERELDRLSVQARMFEPFTRQLFREAGLLPGMRVLDVGCGSGDVAFLAGELVGPTGSVVGVDRAAAAIVRAKARAECQRMSNVQFVEGDPTLIRLDDGFDAIVGRLILMYYPNPIDALRKLPVHLRPGGIVVFQEFDASGCKSHPASPTYERCASWIIRTLQLSGADSHVGLRLYRIFRRSGLSAPILRLDGAISGGPSAPYEALAEVVRSLLPVMERFGIATAAEVEIDNLAQRIRDEILAKDGVIVAPLLIGAWARHPG
jgi:ubiquinone/menaquinone biosynthesis C-methylase UbiE